MGLGSFGDQAVVSQRKYWLFNPLPVGGMGFEGFQCGGKFILGKIQVIVQHVFLFGQRVIFHVLDHGAYHLGIMCLGNGDACGAGVSAGCFHIGRNEREERGEVKIKVSSSGALEQFRVSHHTGEEKRRTMKGFRQFAGKDTQNSLRHARTANGKKGRLALFFCGCGGNGEPVSDQAFPLFIDLLHFRGKDERLGIIF